jgi:hypothetical protein
MALAFLRLDILPIPPGWEYVPIRPRPAIPTRSFWVSIIVNEGLQGKKKMSQELDETQKGEDGQGYICNKARLFCGSGVGPLAKDFGFRCPT